ncbi:helix-turn-helix domain-containing protein [Dasania sp. GY-MA-18]|uniref:Helix-turn-helix domain-containing protein n=1 Tax=Dasania phycosphaerae TaxID=2950436 RepID=A0A9J6RK48_9GAMM|nr:MULTISPECIES: helix-turn-helix domain-containing protein [Dasania]MCR8922640.1 helix-turn-helix domain-containing protein [Dasania sp. GY-MA-18]MCZ0865070.1 helix-turn-helix domain-containing protein [Dasania phycosphaerae]MCZ0868796.1 helix-turn-helix domain-containing protein [Dasania phycosphaerae]
MNYSDFSTNLIPKNRQFESWNDIVTDTYFSLTLETKKKSCDEFCGRIHGEELGSIQITTLASDPTTYHRDRFDISKENQDYFLVTIPNVSAVSFSQNGKNVNCRPGDFILQGSADPYRFLYDEPAQMTVIRIPGDELRDRIKSADDFCARSFLGSTASNGLFLNYLESLLKFSKDLPDTAKLKISEQLIDLLALTMDSSDEALPCADSASQEAHLHRINNYINHNLSSPNLSPQQIADQCGISLRYLHQIFKPTGHTVASWIKERRLKQCYDALADPRRPIRSIAELAYRWGFSDQSHFSRVFKNRFDIPPGQVRANALK